jgi:hypothetical protein
LSRLIVTKAMSSGDPKVYNVSFTLDTDTSKLRVSAVDQQTSNTESDRVSKHYQQNLVASCLQNDLDKARTLIKQVHNELISE